MFSHLTDFGYQRTTKQAVGFYLACLGVTLLISMTVGLTVGVLNYLTGTQNNTTANMEIGIVLALIGVLTVSFLILKEKNLSGTNGCIALTLFAGLVTFILGGLGGFIIPAYFTTLPAKKEKEKKEKAV